MASAAAADAASTYAAVAAGTRTTMPLFDYHTGCPTSSVDQFALILAGPAGGRKDVIAAVNKQSAVHGRK